MGKKKFYAVARGRKVGIYDNWADCKKQVIGCPDARYKGYESREEAEQFILQHNTSSHMNPTATQSTVPKQSVKSKAKKFYAVAVGRSPGVYENWMDCKKQVSAFDGAKYKGFASRDEAEDFIRIKGGEHVFEKIKQGNSTPVSLQPVKTSGKKKFYAVANGRNAGIFKTWDACKRNVVGFDGARYKGFFTIEEALGFVRAHGNKAAQDSIKEWDHIASVDTGSKKKRSNDFVAGNSPKKRKETIELSQFQSDEETMHLYTDGSCVGNDGTNPAGWGVVCVVNGDMAWQKCGPVVLDTNHAKYIYATKGTNNTGELSAIVHSMLKIGQMGEQRNKRYKVVIHADSVYAMNAISRRNKSKKNVELINYGSSVLSDLLEDGHLVRFEHVKGHSGHVWNDRADELANKGRRGIELDEDN